MKKIIIVFLALSLFGCRHALDVKNLDTYSGAKSFISQKERPEIGLVGSEGDAYCSRLTNEIANQLQKQANVTYPCKPGSEKDPEYLVEMKIKSAYEGSFWNWFPISFPGFLIFTPAWYGYGYDAKYDFDINISKEGKTIDFFKVPVNFDIRHADMDRTWIELGWLEVGITALIGGLFSMSYDPDVTPQLMEKVERPLGEYMAAKIMQSIRTKR
jgi:hypothetical protein